MTSIQQLRQQLEKKSTFERAMNGLVAELMNMRGTRMDAELWDAVKRCHALLKARYTGVNFWKLGLRFYNACEALQLDNHQTSSLKQFQQEARQFLGEEDDTPSTTAGADGTTDATAQPEQPSSVVELQRVLLELYARQARSRRSHLSDAGLILDDPPHPHDAELEQATAAAYAALQESLSRAATELNQAPNQTAPSTVNTNLQPSTDRHTTDADAPATTLPSDQQPASEGMSAEDHPQEALSEPSPQPDTQPTPQHETEESSERGADGTSAPSSVPNADERSALQRSILEGIHAVYTGMEAVARGTQAIEVELDTLLASFLSRDPVATSSGPPPASKKLVASLPRLSVTDALLENWGGDTRCPVCTEQLQVGDTVMQLPCKHTYHPDCLQPWLNQHNSCPTCRHQLPTDDPVYEARKEREAEEAEEQRGAENALSHNEFMYL